MDTPIVKRSTTSDNEKTSDFPYRSAVGALLYVARGTRFDISYAVGVLSRSLENPTPKDISCLKRVIRYLNGSINFKLVYKFDPTVKQLECYSDADFAGCPTTSRSTTGVLIKYADAAISWISKRQQLVADSSCEAELIAANEASKETIWISRLFRELINLHDVPVLLVDNENAIRIAENIEFHCRTKHIQRKYLFIRDRIRANMIDVEHIRTEQQLTDILTKPLPCPRLSILREQSGLTSSIV